MNELSFRSREPAGDPQGVLILLHGRGADEDDLFPLFDMLDPGARFLGVCPRGPLALPPGGAHWYQVMRVGYPDPSTFWPTYEQLTGWLDSFLADRGMAHDRLVLGGFSQGAVMSYALTLGPDRPRPAGLIALSGFIPTVEAFDIDLGVARGLPVAIGHGTYDPVITVDWGKEARIKLEQAGAKVLYRESPMPHTIDPAFVEQVREWLPL